MDEELLSFDGNALDVRLAGSSGEPMAALGKTASPGNGWQHAILSRNVRNLRLLKAGKSDTLLLDAPPVP